MNFYINQHQNLTQSKIKSEKRNLYIFVEFSINQLTQFDMPLGPKGKILKRELQNRNTYKNKEENHAS